MQKWIKLGSPEYPTKSQLAGIERAALPVIRELKPEITADGWVLTFSLPPHGVACITLDLSSD